MPCDVQHPEVLYYTAAPLGTTTDQAHKGAGYEAAQDNARAGYDGAPCHKGQDGREDEGEKHQRTKTGGALREFT